MSQNTVIGKVSVTPHGEFLLGSAYSRLSIVSYNGSSYIATQDNQNVPVTDTSNWFLLASKGLGISNIVLQSTIDNVSTYRINYDDGTYFDFTINNGATKTSELTNDGSDGEHPFITNQVNDLVNYQLKGYVGTSLEMTLNNTTYAITLNLKNYSGATLSTQTITLPISGDIVSGSYANGVLTLTKRNGTNLQLSFNDLVPTSRTIAGLSLANDITAEQLLEALNLYTQDEVNALLVPINNRLDVIESNYNTATTEFSSDLDITDALNGYNQGIVVGGQATQDTSKRAYQCAGTESGDYYFVYDSTNYQFTMPTVSAGDVLVFDTNTLKLHLGETEISTTTDNTGTLITLSTTPNPNFAVDIVDVTGTQEIVDSGKNVYNATISSNLNNGVQFRADTQRIYANGTPSTANFRYFKSNRLAAGTYTLVLEIESGSITASTAGALFYVAIGNSINLIGSAGKRFTKTFTLNSASNFQPYFYYRPTEQYNDVVIKYQVIRGSVADYNFEAYRNYNLATLHLGDIHLRSTPDTEYRDRIYHENGKWWLEQNMIQEEASNIAWRTGTTQSFGDSYIFYTVNYFVKKYTTFLCSHLIFGNVYAEDIIGCGATGNQANNQIAVRLPRSIITANDVTLLNSWFLQNNVKFVYCTATPTKTEITSSNYPELYADLQELDKIQTYRGHTIIEVTADEGNPAQLEVTYWKDDSIDFNNRITALENRVALLE